MEGEAVARCTGGLADFTDAKCIEEASKGGFFRFF
ncbi:hypothetical protein ACUODJ_12145 [Escherichia sp. HC-CC]